jgi:selenocysteine lyase/cysteine desulfurase
LLSGELATGSGDFLTPGDLLVANPADLPPETPADWESLRRQMPSARNWAYLDHAAVAPISGPAQHALLQWAQDATEHGALHYPAWSRQIEHLRTLAANLTGGTPEEIALVGNTSAGINIVAEGFPWKPGDNVVTRADEFPANQYPWLHLADRGVETRRLPTDNGKLDLDQLAAACDARTRIVTVSWVAFASGWRHDLDRLADVVHRRGALLFVDAIQALGVFPLNVRATPIDFLAADGHKWLLGPEGAGVFFTRREHLDLLRPVGVGWNSVKNELDFSHIELVFKDSAARYEGGSHNVPGLLALRASLELLQQYGAEALSRRVLELTDLAWHRLAELGAVILSDPRPAHRSGIVSFEMPGRDPRVLQRKCAERGVLLSCRAGCLRISPHAYNDAADIDRLIESLR